MKFFVIISIHILIYLQISGSHLQPLVEWIWWINGGMNIFENVTVIYKLQIVFLWFLS